MRDRIIAAWRACSRLVAARWRIARLAPHAGWRLVATVTFVNVLLGLLPVTFVVGSSILLGRLPAAIGGGPGSSAWRLLLPPFSAAAIALLAQQLLAPVPVALAELEGRRIDGHVFHRLMAAALDNPSIAGMEDQQVLDDLGEASRELESGFQSPGRAFAGLLALVARYLQMAGFAVVVGVSFSWAAAAGVTVSALLFRYGQRGGLRKYSAIFSTLAARRRESAYLRDLATGGAAGKEIRVFGLADWLSGRFQETQRGWMLQVWAERRRIYLKPFYWITGTALVVTAAVLAYLGHSAASGLPLTRLALVAQSILAILRLGDFYPEADVQTQYGMNAYEALGRFEHRTARVGRLAQHDPAPAVTPSKQITFENVAFCYPGSERPVFSGLSLSLTAGRSTAVVGLNGAGKTTLVKLLARLYDPDAGTIRADGIDIRRFGVQDWRREIGVIFQDYIRYEASAADNIGFGAVEHLGDRSGIAAAARAVGIMDTLAALPSGLDTPLGGSVKGGADLSGGQWQRIALARALFAIRHGASVLVLDEPTASLDVRAEARFYDEFMELTRNVTTVLISHRFASVRLADHIIVLDEGRVAEQGSHAELLALDGRYAGLFRLQAKRFAAGQSADATSEASS